MSPAFETQSPSSLPSTFDTSKCLLLMSKEIERHIYQYEAASSPQEKTIALKKVQAASAKLTRLTTPAPQQIQELIYGSNISTSVRIAIEIGLFTALPENGDPISLSALSTKISAEAEFVARISRVLVAFDIIQTTQAKSGFLNGYSHTLLSRFLSSSSRSSHMKFLYDSHLHAQTLAAGPYFRKYGFHSPSNAQNSPFTFAHGATDANFFDLRERMPEMAVLFNEAMAATAVLGLREIVRCYRFDELACSAGGVVLVDVGGGKGHCVNEIVETWPGVEGKFVLEDLGSVLDGGTLVTEDVIVKPYNFFEEVQPIKGANYFFRSIFHDWPDKACLQILHNLAPAMTPNQSRLLICELVIDDESPNRAHVLRDINIMTIGGKERTVADWTNLLNKAHYDILKIHGMDGPGASIIEAVFKTPSG